MPNKSGSGQPKPGSACELVMCEDPETGDLVVRPRGNCPRGYIEKLRDKAEKDGITFIRPKVQMRDEE